MAHLSRTPAVRTAVLDAAHLGDIHGALGTIPHGARSARSWRAHLRTLAAIVGPGLIVMVGDNDAGAFATYSQAGQNYGTTLLWTLLLLVPVLYVNQEMVLRLGAVTGVGHARLILERFGRFWGAFSVIDLFVLNGLTIVTEFIGISIALEYLGIPKLLGVVAAAALTIMAASTGDFRRFERFSLILVLGSLTLLPVFIAVHPPLAQVAHDFVIPSLPDGKLSDILLLVIAIVGTTVAPWQLFFQQSYVIDKRITPRFMKYGQIDLWIGIAMVVIGAAAMMAASAAAFSGTPQAGNFTDSAGVAAGIAAYAGKLPAAFFAIALLDASIIGASAVSLATAYAIGDTLKVRHSLHRKPTDAGWFYLVYGGLIAGAAALVLMPSAPLGLITVAVQTLAGVLLPSATVFLLLLCNDKAVLGPWVNGRWLNLFTGLVIAALVILSVILVVSVLFPDVSEQQVLMILIGGVALAVIGASAGAMLGREAPQTRHMKLRRLAWRMPPLDTLAPPPFSRARRAWLLLLQLHLGLTCAAVIVRVVQLAQT